MQYMRISSNLHQSISNKNAVDGLYWIPCKSKRGISVLIVLSCIWFHLAHGSHFLMQVVLCAPVSRIK